MLPQGARLPNEVVLAERFGVSRATLREALRLLTADSLIRTAKGAGGGSFVTAPSAEQLSESLRSGIGMLTAADDVTLEQLLEVRELLEVPAAELAARRRGEDHLERLHASIPGEPLLTADRGAVRLQPDFHSIVIEACSNTLLSIAAQPIFAILQTHLARSRLGRELPPGDQRASSRDRGGDRGGDERAAGERMFEHLEFLRPYYEQAWRETAAA